MANFKSEAQRRAVMAKYRLKEPGGSEVDELVRDEDGTYVYMPRRTHMAPVGLSAGEYEEKYGTNPQIAYTRYTRLGATHLRKPKRPGD